MSRLDWLVQTAPRVCLALLLAGCASTEPEHYFILEPVAGATSARPGGTSVILGRVTLPVLVDRSEMVFQEGGGRVQVSEQNRWAEPLRDGVGRVLAEDLTTRLGGALVTTYPEEPASGQHLIRISVDIRQWQVWPGQRVSVIALWVIATNAQGQGTSTAAPAEPIRTAIEIPIAAPGSAAAVAAQSEALSKLADVIASAIQRQGSS